MSFPPQGGNGSVQVNANRDCSWSAQATAGWIHLATASGQGDGIIAFSVDANPQTATRDGAIEVANAGQVSVTQAPQPPPPPVAPNPDPNPLPEPPPPPAPGDPGAAQVIEIKGEVSFLIGQCPDLGFMLAARIVRTTADTEFKGLKCGDLRNGRNVKVKGVVRNDGIVMATEVRKD